MVSVSKETSLSICHALGNGFFCCLVQDLEKQVKALTEEKDEALQAYNAVQTGQEQVAEQLKVNFTERLEFHTGWEINTLSLRGYFLVSFLSSFHICLWKYIKMYAVFT